MITELVIYAENNILNKVTQVVCSCQTVAHYETALKFCEIAKNAVISEDAKQLISNQKAQLKLILHRISK